jgi:hypothetical protein
LIVQHYADNGRYPHGVEGIGNLLNRDNSVNIGQLLALLNLIKLNLVVEA